MSLLQDNRINENNSKKLLVRGGIALIILIFIIVALLAVVSSMGKSKISLVINNQKYNQNSFLIVKDINGSNVTYIDVENLTRTLAGGYKYGSGNKDIEDDNQCYVTCSTVQETTFFKVGAKQYYKVSDETNDIEYYNLESEIIKENGKIYIPINSCEHALNLEILFNKNQYTITSIDKLMDFYNQQESKTFVPDSSIVWETSNSNKKLLKYGMVIIKDSEGQLGVGTVSYSYNKKSKVTTITTSQILTPKHTYINYIEQYNQLIVESKDGRGVVQLKNDNGVISKQTIISPQYTDIKPINDKMYLVSKKIGNTDNSTNSNSSDSKSDVRYGIVDNQNNTILNCEYEQIGLDMSKFTNNDLTNNYIIYDNFIPVKKNKLWGFVNLKGSVVIDFQYSDLGCKDSNSNSNVLIIPEINGIVVKQDKNYGIISNDGKVIIRNVLTRVYKEQENNKEVYYMIYNGVNRNILEFIENAKSSNSSSNSSENIEKPENTNKEKIENNINKQENNTQKSNNNSVQITID